MKGKEYSYPVKAYIYLVHLLCSKYDGKFKSVGCNKFTLFPILGVERSFPFPGKVATGKGSFPFPGKAATGKGSFPFPGKAATGKGFINFGKAATGKGTFPRKGVVCNWERFQQFWERCNWERF